MGIVITIIVAFVVLLYLIIVASDETRRIKINKQHKRVPGKISLAVKMTIKLCEKEKEINKLKDANMDLRDECEENKIIRYKTIRFLDNIVSQMYSIHTINNHNILEYDKKQRIDLATKAVSEECLEFIKKELDELSKTSSS